LNLESTPLIGGWEDVLQKEEKIVDGKTTMFEVELWTKPRRRESVYQYVTDKVVEPFHYMSRHLTA